jgi:hypothetical protein
MTFARKLPCNRVGSICSKLWGNIFTIITHDVCKETSLANVRDRDSSCREITLQTCRFKGVWKYPHNPEPWRLQRNLLVNAPDGDCREITLQSWTMTFARKSPCKHARPWCREITLQTCRFKGMRYPHNPEPWRLQGNLLANAPDCDCREYPYHQARFCYREHSSLL